MIKQPEELNFSDKNFSMILYGSPGTGKTTLALSAPAPILIDFDRGISRVKAQHRKATIVCSSYMEVLADLESPELANYKTIIVDTGGSFVTFLKDWAQTEKGAVTKSGEFNGLKGFGFVKNEFAAFTSKIKDVMNKNIIYVFHSTEEKDKDGNPIQRLVCEGAARNTVWTPCDFGGYIQMIGTTRTISFTPEQEFFAKGCHGIKGRYNIPELGEADNNDFITRLFEKAKGNIAAESAAFAPLKAKYDEVMEIVHTMVNGITDADSANVVTDELQEIDHVLTSKKEASAALQKRTRELGLRYVKGSGYVAAEEQ